MNPIMVSLTPQSVAMLDSVVMIIGRPAVITLMCAYRNMVIDSITRAVNERGGYTPQDEEESHRWLETITRTVEPLLPDLISSIYEVLSAPGVDPKSSESYRRVKMLIESSVAGAALAYLRTTNAPTMIRWVPPMRAEGGSL